jgi:hypothetical protein
MVAISGVFEGFSSTAGEGVETELEEFAGMLHAVNEQRTIQVINKWIFFL